VHIKEKIFPVLLQYNHNAGTIIVDDSFDPTIVSTIAEETEMSDLQVERILRFARAQLLGCIDVDAISPPEDQLDNESQMRFSIDLIEATTDGPFEIVERKVLRENLEKLLASFTSREQEIIRLRFGFDGVPQTLEEVGQIFNITRERVRQIENKCIRRLRHPSKAKIIRDFYC